MSEYLQNICDRPYPSLRNLVTNRCVKNPERSGHHSLSR